MIKLMTNTFEDFKVDFNKVTVKELFYKYEEIGFIYPAKKALLTPYFNLIIENWEKLLKSKEDLLWILTKNHNGKYFASVSVWQYNNYGVQAQHLVSNGNPFLSLKTMLAAQMKAKHHYARGEMRTSQNWFRPNNRYAYRVFASMYEKLGPRYASLLAFHYLFLRLDKVKYAEQNLYWVEEVSVVDNELISFIAKQYNEVFVRAEELDQEDIDLSLVNKVFQKYGLKRSRKVLKISDKQSGKIVACILANRAPLGLNFSFLENRAFYILDKRLDRNTRKVLIQTMNQSIKHFYKDFELKAIPIVTDETSSAILQQQGAEFFRVYMQSIWGEEGFSLWYDHIESFLKRIEKRFDV